ncbi:hypothetical protein [Serratia sp. NFX21]|uniref:hypothetical protein n=1 Tax=Serratia sp. NFX21 TaxID=3402279 RepID=UPI003AF3E41C
MCLIALNAPGLRARPRCGIFAMPTSFWQEHGHDNHPPQEGASMGDNDNSQSRDKSDDFHVLHKPEPPEDDDEE